MKKYWYDDAIFYSIYPLGAVNAKRENDYARTTEGMAKLLDWVPHVVSTGCNALNLAPVFESQSHGYDTTDYRLIDSRLGTNEQFVELVARCHEAGVRVVVDGVFNHTGRDFFAFKDIRQHRERSQYRDWYQNVNFGAGTPRNDGFSYEAWRGHYELPRLNPHCAGVREYLFDTVRGWIREFDIDGIRLDCADCLDFGFMRELREVCTAMKEDFWLMGEVIHGDYSQWANPQTLHSVTNYECAKGLYSSHNDGNMHEIAHSLGRQFGSGGIYKGLTLFSFADNHDVNRIADTVRKQEFLPTVYTILYTMPGTPSVYYGSEWGIHGVTDRVTDWNLRPQIDIATVKMENPALTAHIAALAKARGQSPALRYGSYEQIAVSSHQYAFRRAYEGDEAVVLVNIADAPAQVSAPIGGDMATDLLTGETFAAAGGRVSVPVPAHGSRILRPAGGSARAAAPQQTEQPAPVQTRPAPQPVPRSAPPPAPPEPPRPAPEPEPPAPPAPAKRGHSEIIHARAEELAPVRVAEHPTYEHICRELVDSGSCRAALYELAPGKSAYPYHYHSAGEDVYYILSGQGFLRTASGERRVAAGDLVYFPAGEAGTHRLINNHHETLRYLAFRARTGEDAIVFPDSRKELRGGKVFRDGKEAGYYDGE